MTSALDRLEPEQKDIELSLELELSTEIARAYKKIDKTENILSAMLLITDGYRKSNSEVKDSDSDMMLIDKIEALVYETVEDYHTDRVEVKDSLSLMMFYIRTLRLKDIISNEQTSQLLSAYTILANAYDEIQLQKDTLEKVNVKDIELNLSLDEGISVPVEEVESNDFRDMSNTRSVPRSSLRDSISAAPKTRGQSAELGRREYAMSRVGDSSKGQVLQSNTKSIPSSVIKDNLMSTTHKRQDSRRSEILRLLSRDPITIKDISARVLGCSEKTIQRELNSMLDDGTIMRIGEKRWSKYIIA